MWTTCDHKFGTIVFASRNCMTDLSASVGKHNFLFIYLFIFTVSQFFVFLHCPKLDWLVHLLYFLPMQERPPPYAPSSDNPDKKQN